MDIDLDIEDINLIDEKYWNYRKGSYLFDTEVDDNDLPVETSVVEAYVKESVLHDDVFVVKMVPVPVHQVEH